MTEAEKAERERRLDLVSKKSRQSLVTFTRFTDTGYIADPVHRFIAEKLEQVRRGEIKRLILNMPPRHGKSRLVSVDYPAWLMGHHPKWDTICASYSANLSELHSKQARKILKSEEYRQIFPSVRLDPMDSSTKDWANNYGGRYKAVGVLGDITGRGADLLIIDDPHKNAEEARSETMRNKVWEWFLSDAYTRLAPHGAIVIIMTRWHEDDLVGRLLDEKRVNELKEAGIADEEWYVINLPAIAKDNDPMGRRPGEALSPSRYPLDRLNGIKATLSDYQWASLYDGDPVPAGGQYAQVDHFQFLKSEDVPDGLRWVRYWDLSVGKNVKSDKTAGALCAIDDDGNLIIGNIKKGSWKWPIARKVILMHGSTEHGVEVGVEAIAGFGTAFANLQEEAPPDMALREFASVSGDKLTCALPWLTLLEKRKVFLVRGDWNMPFLKEVAAFPDGKNDDQVDAVSGGYNMLTNRRPLLIV